MKHRDYKYAIYNNIGFILFIVGAYILINGLMSSDNNKILWGVGILAFDIVLRVARKKLFNR